MVPVPSYPMTGDQDSWSDVTETPEAPSAGSSFPKEGAAKTVVRISEGFSLRGEESGCSGNGWKPVEENQTVIRIKIVKMRDRDISNPIINQLIIRTLWVKWNRETR